MFIHLILPTFATLAAAAVLLALGLTLRYGWLRLLEWRRRVL